MHGELDAMIRNAVLWEVISPDFFRTVTGTNLGFSGRSFFFLFALFFHVKEPGLQNLHGLVLVFELAPFILAAHHNAGGEVGDTHGGVGGVHGLARHYRRNEKHPRVGPQA